MLTSKRLDYPGVIVENWSEYVMIVFCGLMNGVATIYRIPGYDNTR